MMAENCPRQMAVASELITSISNGRIARVAELLDSGAISVEDASTVACNAVHYAAVNGQAEILRELIRRGFRCNSKDSLGYTPLHLAAAHGHVASVTVLLEASPCLVNGQDIVHGNTAVHDAAWNGFSQTLQELVHKADVNLYNKMGFSALHLSSQNGHNECTRILLFAGCNANHKNNYGDTALHTAARYAHAGVTRILLIGKCPVNEQNPNGDTVLHIAASQKLHKITKMLLQAGVNPSIRNNQNERAVDIARRKGHEEILQLLGSNVVTPVHQMVTPVHQLNISSDSSAYVVPLAPSTSSSTDNSITKQKKSKWSLFWKKNKNKDKIKSDLVKISSANVENPVPQQSPSHFPYQPYPAPGFVRQGTGQTVSIDPETVLRSFHLNQVQKHRALKHGPGGGGAASNTTNFFCEPLYPVPGLQSQYTIQDGVQYYRDLAGNIRQGPVGYVPETSTFQQRASRSKHDVPRQYGEPPLPAYIQRYPAGEPVLTQYDHLSYLRNRNLNMACGAAFVPPGHHHPYSQPMQASGQRTQTGNQVYFPTQVYGNFTPEIVPPGQIYRSRSDETLSTVSSCHHPPAFCERTRSIRVNNTPLKRHRLRMSRMINKIAIDNPEYFESKAVDSDPHRLDRHQRIKKSLKDNQTLHVVMEKTEKPETLTSGESGVDACQPSTSNILLPAPNVVQSTSDANSNPDSGYGGSKACLQHVITSLNQMTLSNSSSFQSSEDITRNNSENRLTSSTDNASVVSSAPSGSVVSLCNSL